MEGRCKNKDCNRLIFDTEKLDELQDKIECQHCHHVNIIRQAGAWVFGVKKKKKAAPSPRVKAKKKAALEPVAPAPSPEEIAREPEDLSQAASPAFQGDMRDESPEPAPEGTVKEEG